MNFWIVVTIIAIVLVSLDKGITAYNVKAVAKNNPGVNPYSIERNPLAKWTFQKFGLTGGTIIYWFLSIVTFIMAVYLFSYPARVFAPNNAYGVALYVVMMVYGLVIFNNLYFSLRYNKII